MGRCLGLAFALGALGGVAQAQTDITALVLSLPGVPEAIAGLCDQACLGDERLSWLERATLLPGPTLVFELRLRNRQTILGNVLEDIAHVTATATITPLTCQVTAWSVESNNDLYNAALPLLTEEIERELATLEAQCREVLPG